MTIKSFFMACALIIAITPVAKADSELPVDVRADIQLQEIIRAAKSGQTEAALKKIDDYRLLENEGHKTPPAVLFFEAKQASKAGQHERAFIALEAYLAVANHSDSSYNEAVKLYAGMKDKAEKEARARAEKEEQDARVRAEKEGQKVSATLAQAKQRRIFRDCPDCPEMVALTAVSFWPAFAMGKYEVTQGQWKAIMGSPPTNLNFENCGLDCPVENVSWNDAKEFIQRLNSKTGKQYRLPSEAEWEYACRAGGRQRYCGSDNEDRVSWYKHNSGNTTHPAGRKQPNAWGLYDMSGNVWEWVEGCYDGNCKRRVLRGGAWDDNAWDLRADGRSGIDPGYRNGSNGFRIARTLP